jgi:hypothetical protein
MMKSENKKKRDKKRKRKADQRRLIFEKKGKGTTFLSKYARKKMAKVNTENVTTKFSKRMNLLRRTDQNTQSNLCHRCTHRKFWFLDSFLAVYGIQRESMRSPPNLVAENF